MMAVAVDTRRSHLDPREGRGGRASRPRGRARARWSPTTCSRIGELADLARRVRGGDDRVFFVQNLYLNQTNVCRVKCKFCAFAATQKQEQAYTITPDELVADAARAARSSPASPRSTW